MEPLTRCDNGHYYDSAKHTSCPYCGVQNLGLDIQKTMAKRSGESNYEAGITRPIMAPQEEPEKDKSMGQLQGKASIEPVTGWLVSISGPEKGCDYRLTMERNFIGRSENMDVRISEDDYVSRDNHAAVSYSPKKNTYHLYPGDSKGLVYLNDKEVLTPEQLKPFDIIELGMTKLMFVPLCGDEFTWDMHSDNKNEE